MSATTHEVLEDRSRRQLSLGPHNLLASGGAGAVYAHPEDPSLCIKLYSTSEQRRLHQTKVAAMIARTPDNVRTKSGVVQLAWPKELVLENGDFAGFTMPRLPLQDTWPFDILVHPKSRRNYGAPDSLKLRLTLLRNLAAVLIGLHEKGHYAIDLQPKNVFAYRWTPGVSTPSSGFVALIDCDGFSISGGTASRHHAGLLMEEYACPAAFDHALSFDASRVVGLERQQDLWAFAVLAFRLLNNGLAPWDCVPKSHLVGATSGGAPASTTERIVEIDRIYSFGARANPDFRAPATSRHEWFAKDLTALFERTFRASNHEPSLQEWLEVLERLLTPQGACANDAEHWKLGSACGECELQARRPPTQQILPPSVAAPSGPAGLPGQTAPAPVVPSPVVQPPVALSPGGAPPVPPPTAFPMWLIAAVGVGAYLALSPAMPWRKGPSPGQPAAPASAPAPTASTAAPPLVHQTAAPLQWFRLLSDFPSTDAYWNTVEAQNELSRRQALLEADNSATILRCDYDAGSYTRFEYYWKDGRSAQAAPAVLTAVQPDHPFLRVRDARRDCPAEWDGGDLARDWSRLTQAGRAKRAVPTPATHPSESAPPERQSATSAPPPRVAPEEEVSPGPGAIPQTVSVEDAEGARRLVGEWQGNYTCAQGPTGVTVRLDATPSGTLAGVFEFYPIAMNPNAPSGAYKVRAFYRAASKALVLEPVAWIRRPPGYKMVGARLRAPPDARVLNGGVPSLGCSSISLSRN